MTVHPSCYRSQAKRDRTPSKDWVRRMIEKAYTSDEWIARFRELEAKDQVRFLIDVQPKVNINENNGLVVRIMLDGITQKIPVQGRVIEQAALDAHTDPVPDDL